MPIDSEIVLYLNSIVQSSPALSDTTIFFASYFPWIVILSVLLWLVFLPHTTKEKVSIAVFTFVSVLISRFAITEVIRFFYHRPRPYVQHSDIHALFNVNEWSFPSGHATIFFSIATAVFFFNKKMGAGLFAAIIISLGRIAAGVHFPTDILAGMLIGFGITYLVLHLFNRNNRLE